MAEKTATKIATMDDIMASNDVEYAEIPGFKVGETLRLQSLTAGDFIEWQEANDGEAKKTAGLRLIVKSLVDADGKRIADDTHLAVLRKKSVKHTERIVKEIVRMNGLNTKEEAATKKD